MKFVSYRGPKFHRLLLEYAVKDTSFSGGSTLTRQDLMILAYAWIKNFTLGASGPASIHQQFEGLPEISKAKVTLRRMRIGNFNLTLNTCCVFAQKLLEAMANDASKFPTADRYAVFMNSVYGYALMHGLTVEGARVPDPSFLLALIYGNTYLDISAISQKLNPLSLDNTDNHRIGLGLLNLGRVITRNFNLIYPAGGMDNQAYSEQVRLELRQIAEKECLDSLKSYEGIIALMIRNEFSSYLSMLSSWKEIAKTINKILSVKKEGDSSRDVVCLTDSFPSMDLTVNKLRDDLCAMTQSPCLKSRDLCDTQSEILALIESCYSNIFEGYTVGYSSEKNAVIVKRIGQNYGRRKIFAHEIIWRVSGCADEKEILHDSYQVDLVINKSTDSCQATGKGELIENILGQ